MKPVISEYYGDNNRWFIATVVETVPRDGYEGRVKIRIHGLHSSSNVDIPEDDLPWAQCIIPTTEGGVSGIGKMPKLQRNALVFGFFMDGMHSQTPVVFGSIPHIELPTQIQLGQPEEDVGNEKPETFFGKVANAFKPDQLDIDNSNTGFVGTNVKRNRERTAVQTFLNVGYTLNQAIAITAGLDASSGLRTGRNRQFRGLANFSRKRFADLQAFSNDFNDFTTQINFIIFELRGRERNANIQLLQTQNLYDEGGACRTFARFYLKKRPVKDESFFKKTENLARRLSERVDGD